MPLKFLKKSISRILKMKGIVYVLYMNKFRKVTALKQVKKRPPFTQNTKFVKLLIERVNIVAH